MNLFLTSVHYCYKIFSLSFWYHSQEIVDSVYTINYYMANICIFEENNVLNWLMVHDCTTVGVRICNIVCVSV